MVNPLKNIWDQESLSLVTFIMAPMTSVPDDQGTKMRHQIIKMHENFFKRDWSFCFSLGHRVKLSENNSIDHQACWKIHQLDKVKLNPVYLVGAYVFFCFIIF